MSLFQRELLVLDQEICNKKAEIGDLENNKNTLNNEKTKLIFLNWDIDDKITSKVLKVRKSRKSSKKIQDLKFRVKMAKIVGYAITLILSGYFLLNLNALNFLIYFISSLLNAFFTVNYIETCNLKILMNKGNLVNRKEEYESILNLESEKSMNKVKINKMEEKILEIDGRMEFLKSDIDNLRHTYEKILYFYEKSQMSLDSTMNMEERENKLNSDYEKACKGIVLNKYKSV